MGEKKEKKIQHRGFKPPYPPPKPKPKPKPKKPDVVIINENFELPNILAEIFPKCKFCGGKHWFFSFGNEYLCKRCCSCYDVVGTQEYKLIRFKLVESVREMVKNDLNLNKQKMDWED